MSAVRELVVWLEDREVARVRRDRGGKCRLTYDDGWRYARGAYPLSLSMPLAGADHGPRVVEPFLWGLLPDNEWILERWARRFQVSARNAFALVEQVGSDCAGAMRLLPADVDREQDDGVDWLDEQAIAERLRELHADVSAWRREGDAGQFSLAGAQPKIALWWDGTRWGIPRGRTPTTHILKPGIVGRDGQAENEHFCMALAADVGLAVAKSRVAAFEEQVVIVIERYDRVWRGDTVVRVHQEDACQALGVHPARKYEAEGGPGAKAIVELLRDHARRVDDDVSAFVDALIFNWVIAGTDAHAKNYSFLIGGEGLVRLAPLYDVASLLPYPDFSPHKTKLAMRIGGKYRLRDIDGHSWQKLAKALHIDADRLRARMLEIAKAIPDAASDVDGRCADAGLDHPLLPRLSRAIRERAASCVHELSRSVAAT